MIDARDLDLFIADKIMTWVVIPETKSYMPQRGGEGTLPEIPRFSMDDSTYAILMPRLEELGAKVTVQEQPKQYSRVQMYTAGCEFRGVSFSSGKHERKSTAIAEAVCAAFGFEPLQRRSALQAQTV